MINFLKTITLNDFVPPLITRVIRKVQRKLNRTRIHPFDCIPDNVRPLWYLDVGANIGAVTTAALTSYPECRAICFEPVPDTYEMLKRNLGAFGDRCVLYNYALAENNGEGEINITSFHGANSILKQSEMHKKSSGVKELRTEKIKLIKLDDISKEFKTQKIDIMKIDVEGFELSVLEGGRNFIKDNVDIIIIELSPYRNDTVRGNYVTTIFQFMKDSEFTLINIYDLTHTNDHPDLMLGQMDCVFRRNANLK